MWGKRQAVHGDSEVAALQSAPTVIVVADK